MVLPLNPSCEIDHTTWYVLSCWSPSERGLIQLVGGTSKGKARERAISLSSKVMDSVVFEENLSLSRSTLVVAIVITEKVPSKNT